MYVDPNIEKLSIRHLECITSTIDQFFPPIVVCLNAELHIDAIN
jgi:hypothetical protein